MSTIPIPRLLPTLKTENAAQFFVAIALFGRWAFTSDDPAVQITMGLFAVVLLVAAVVTWRTSQELSADAGVLRHLVFGIPRKSISFDNATVRLEHRDRDGVVNLVVTAGRKTRRVEVAVFTSSGDHGLEPYLLRVLANCAERGEQDGAVADTLRTHAAHLEAGAPIGASPLKRFALADREADARW